MKVNQLDNERLYAYWLANLPGIGAVKIRRLLELYRTPKEIYNIEETTLENVSCLQQQDKRTIMEYKGRLPECAGAYHRMEEKGIRFITTFEPEYPKRLICLEDRPFALYVKGELPEEDRPSVAIVGARQCTSYGREMAAYLGRTLSEAGISVISGMAYGVDGASQRGAVSGKGKSFAVLGCGVDICYPREHINLYMQLEKQGGLISEFAPSTQPLPQHFPMRNRIISGLCDALIVIEAREKSGSLITADFALEQGKEIFALPGRVGDKLSAGCNQLIKNGANLLLAAEDITDFFGFFGKHLWRVDEKQNLGLANDEKMVYSCLDLYPKHLEAIVVETGLGAARCMAALIQLETGGWITSTAGNYYAKNYDGGCSHR